MTALLALIEPLDTADGAQETDTLIEEVVVTAAKREQGVYDVSASLSVFGGRDLSERGIADLVDIGRFVPNLNATTSPPGTRPRRIHSRTGGGWWLAFGRQAGNGRCWNRRRVGGAQVARNELGCLGPRRVP